LQAQRNCTLLAKQLAAAKERADKAERRVEEEKERFKRFHKRTEKKLGELVSRTEEVREFK
jgi:prefoldin subunit 5